MLYSFYLIFKTLCLIINQPPIGRLLLFLKIFSFFFSRFYRGSSGVQQGYNKKLDLYRHGDYRSFAL